MNFGAKCLILLENNYVETPASGTQCLFVDATGMPSVKNSSGTITSLPQIQSDWNQAKSTVADFIKNKPTIPSVTRTTSTSTLSLVSTGATGTQISASKDSSVTYCVSTSTTATIGSAASSSIALKKCATNSATEGDWTTVGTAGQSQSLGLLALSISSTQTITSFVCTDLPAGWYVKLVSSGSGTHSESFVSGEKTIYG